MTKKWIGINLLLFIVAAVAVYQLYVSMQRFEDDNALENIKPPAEARADIEILPPPPPEERFSPMDFAVIPDKNVFSETRTKGETAEEPAAGGTLPDSQKPTLVGVIISEKQKVATIMEPGARGQPGEIILKKLGEMYQNYTITEIAADHIVLDGGDRKVTVELNDISQPAQNRRTVVVSTRVIPIGGATASAAAAPVTVVSGQSRLGRTVPTRTLPQQAVPVAGIANPNFIVPAGMGAPGATEQQGAPVPQSGVEQQTSPTPAQDATAPQGRTRIIRSPFGEIIRNRSVP